MKYSFAVNCIVSLVALVVFCGCSSSKETVQPTSPLQASKIPISQELNAFACPEEYLRGAGIGGDYNQALDYAISQIAVQIQSSVVLTSTMRTNSNISADGSERILSSYEQKSQVMAELRNRQDVRVLQTIARDGVVGVVTCMSRMDAAKPFREDYQKSRDALVSSIAVLSMTTHPREKIDNYAKMTSSYSKYKESLQMLQSLDLNETSAEIEEKYAKAVEGYVEFRSKYKVYIDGAFESEEGKVLFEQIANGVKLQSLENSCEVGLVLELEVSTPICKEGGLGISCTEVVALNGKSCRGETYFTLGGTLKGIGRKDEDEARAKIVSGAAKNDFVGEWKKEIDRWLAR